MFDARRALHSFPTRRSSDLGIASVLVFPSVYFPFASELAGLLYSKRERSEGTRLNSSHVRISYAVVCLKKKISVTATMTKDPRRHNRCDDRSLHRYVVRKAL